MRAIITLTGPSGAGKSTVIRELVRIGGSVLSPVVIPKYTTRPPRDEDLVRSPELREVISVSTLPSECDLVYEQYGDRYGLAFADLYRALRRGQSPIVILNDVRAVEDVRSALGKIVHSLFVFRETPMLDKYERLASERGVTNRSEPWTVLVQRELDKRPSEIRDSDRRLAFGQSEFSEALGDRPKGFRGGRG